MLGETLQVVGKLGLLIVAVAAFAWLRRGIATPQQRVGSWFLLVGAGLGVLGVTVDGVVGFAARVISVMVLLTAGVVFLVRNPRAHDGHPASGESSKGA